MDIVLCIGCLAIISAYFLREHEYQQELKDSYEEGYKAGLNENVIKMSSED